MARIRTMKPELWGDEKLAPLPPIHRLVFLGLISQADDAGRLMDSVRYIDGLLFSLTDDSCAASLDTLARVGVIRRGTTASGQRVIQIVGWEKHQKVDKPSRKAMLPPPLDTPKPNGYNGYREPREIVASEERGMPEPDARVSRSDLGAVDLRPTTYDLRPTTDDRKDRGPERLAAWPDVVAFEVGTDPESTAGRPAGRSDAALDLNPLTAHPVVASRLAVLQHGGGYAASAELVRERYLDAEAGPETSADVAGVPLADREAIVLEALADYRTKHQAFDPRLFAGFVRRAMEQAPQTPNGIVKLHQVAPAEPDPVISPEDRAEGLRIIRELKGTLRPATAVVPDAEIPDPGTRDSEPGPGIAELVASVTAMPAETVDPETVERREAERQRQRELLGRVRT